MNNLRDIERNCKALMTIHGVGSIGFEFDNHKKRIGACHYTRVNGVRLAMKITVSKHFAEILQMEEIRETMLHEIAHALTPGAGHGPRWVAKARELGIARPTPKKTTSASPETPWKGYCASCGTCQGKQHRAPLRVYLCAAPVCKRLRYTERILNWKKNDVFVAAQNMPDRFYREWLKIQSSVI